MQPHIWRNPNLLDRLKMSIKYKTTERLGAWGTLSSSQHFGGVEGRVGAPGWDSEELTSFNYIYKPTQNQHKVVSA
jgi:hypothetical protein